ncbi:MAG: hypothetical protein LBI61_03215 [Puniceicoccales bacterium]|nr:hypothetical protein [Puniceicoccales bacterium]
MCVREIIEKMHGYASFLQKFPAKIRQFFAKRKLEMASKITFEKINTLSPWQRIRFALCKKTLKKLYVVHLQRLRGEAKRRKIRVAFLINSTSKWHCEYLYDLFDKSDNFEPLMLATKGSPKDSLDGFHRVLAVLESSGKRFARAYDPVKRKYLSLKMFNPDIVFYEQPWGVEFEHRVPYVANFALACYTPYCFHLLHSEYNYLEKFHGFLWKYFVESTLHLESYRSKFNADNCVSVGSLHLDGYLSKKTLDVAPWKDKSPHSKRIIYAPHFSIGVNHRMATFHQNGQFMLNLADMYAGTTWIVRPHPDLRERAIGCGLMTEREFADYWSEWEKYGTVSWGGDFIDLFKTSDCLITDCISFLADYFPTGKPVFHLRSGEQAARFNDFAESIIETYYQIHNNAELERLFSRVIIGGDDFMAARRRAQAKTLGLIGEEMASKRVFDYIKSELNIQ